VHYTYREINYNCNLGWGDITTFVLIVTSYQPKSTLTLHATDAHYSLAHNISEGHSVLILIIDITSILGGYSMHLVSAALATAHIGKFYIF
jgi:hypothetical protein